MKSVPLTQLKKIVKKVKKEIEGFDRDNIGDLKRIMELASEEFDIEIDVSFDEEEGCEYITLFDVEDEELLDKILELAVGDGMECSVSYLFEGNIIRNFT